MKTSATPLSPPVLEQNVMPETGTSIEHVVPHVGLTTVSLHAPADSLYLFLKKSGEVSRLNHLRHLGALSHALPGARDARWDYTVALAHYAQCLHVSGMSNSFKIGAVEFSSATAALQTIALCWNIGHLPGTFAVEKGVCRFLHGRNRHSPASVLTWPNDGEPEINHVKEKANLFLRRQDYLGLARVLAAMKLLSMTSSKAHALHGLTRHFAVPFLLSYDEGESKQWDKLRRAFGIVRHLAYLTLDMVLSGLQWCPSIPSLLRQQLDREGMDLEELSDCICEILSPIERLTYSCLYHREAARRETAVVADWVQTYLEHCDDAPRRINDWLRRGLFQDLRIGRRPSSRGVAIAASIRLRTHFSGLRDSPSRIESLLGGKRFPLPLVLRYPAWNSETIIEPDELIVDAIVNGSPSPDDVGRLLVWMIGEFETRNAAPGDVFELLRKADFERAYVSLLKRAIELSLPDVTAAIEPWPLARFGLFPDMSPAESRGAVWACAAELDDRMARHIVRDRRRSLPQGLRDRYAELLGIRELRKYLRRKWAGKGLRQRCLLVTASVRLRRGGRDLIEYDGGIIAVSSRSGRIEWYGLESKRGDGDPLASLRDRLDGLGIEANTHRLSARYAVAKMVLRQTRRRPKSRQW